jgi:hypothetical protein
MSEWWPTIWLIGVVVSAIVLHYRVGFPDVRLSERVDWREFLIPNIPWFALNLLKMWFWPVTLAAWLVQGMRKSRWRAVTSVNGRPTRRIIRVSPTG